MGKGEVARWEDGCGVGEEMSYSSELGGMGRGGATQWEDGWGVGDKGSSSGEFGGIVREEGCVEPDSCIRGTMKRGV